MLVYFANAGLKLNAIFNKLNFDPRFFQCRFLLIFEFCFICCVEFSLLVLESLSRKKGVFHGN